MRGNTDTAGDITRIPSAQKGKILEGPIFTARRKEKFLEYQTAHVQGPTRPEKVSLFLYTISLAIKIAVFQYLPALTLSGTIEMGK